MVTLLLSAVVSWKLENQKRISQFINDNALFMFFFAIVMLWYSLIQLLTHRVFCWVLITARVYFRLFSHNVFWFVPDNVVFHTIITIGFQNKITRACSLCYLSVLHQATPLEPYVLQTKTHSHKHTTMTLCSRKRHMFAHTHMLISTHMSSTPAWREWLWWFVQRNQTWLVYRRRLK